MPANRLSMRKIKEVLRLKWANKLSDRKIAQSCNISRPAVVSYVGRAVEAGLSWPLPDTLKDAELERLLFPALRKTSTLDRALPDLLKVHQELQKKNVTLFLLWQEYREQHPKGYQYSWFCDQYRNWLGSRDLSMRQTHRAGEKLFVDYAGHTLPVIDPRTGEIRSAQIFVAVLGASNYTYAEATWSQSLPDWIGSHQRTFIFLGGLPELVVPDNLRSGVTKAHRYEPDLNPTYLEMATHYGVAIVPARVRKPKDKAKARERQHFSVKLKWDPSDFSAKNLLAVNACGCPSRPARSFQPNKGIGTSLRNDSTRFRKACIFTSQKDAT